MEKGIKEGDVVEVVTSDEKIKGRYLPSKDNVIIKLDSGYNIGISRNKIKKIKLVKRHRVKNKKLDKIKRKKGLPIISILHTGGTISSRVSYETGGVSPKFKPEEIVEMFPEIEKIANVKCKFISNIFSEDLRFEHYNLIAKEIEKEIKRGVDGIVVTHGTDTMHYTAAALSFMLEDLPIPVLLVGSQRSSDRGSSDAALNIISAFQFIAKSDFSEVGICMHNSMRDDNCVILPGTKTRKMHASRRDAFRAINTKPWALVNREGKIQYIKTDFKKKDKRKLKLKLFKKVKVGVLKMHPNMFAEEISRYRNFDGLVLEGSGVAGNFPINKTDRYTVENKKIYLELKKLVKKIPLFVTSQTVFGRINMNVYSTGRKMKEIGILGDYNDMTSETAFIKLAWLLSNYKKDKVKALMSENLRGEILKRTEAYDDFLG